MERTPTKRAAPGGVRAFKPSLGAEEAEALREAVESGWLGTGIYTRLFESRLSRETGARFALATNSGTAALHLALKALNVEGGEVVTTPVTSVATSHAILYNRAAPVFCDVDPETGNIDPAKLPGLITPKTRAIMAVHLGQACDMDGILEAARRQRIPVVEDVCACHAVGGFYRDRPLGTIGELGCFSFGRFKGLTTVEGGALVHGGEARQRRLTRLRRLGHAEEEGGLAEGPEGVRELGFHYRMSDLSAAVGLAQFKRREALQARLDSILKRYRSGLADVPFLRLPQALTYSRGVRAYASVTVLGGRRDPLRRHMRESGIQVNDVLFPNHRYALYAPYRRRLPAAEKYCAETLHLPYYPDLTDADVDRVVETVRRFKG